MRNVHDMRITTTGLFWSDFRWKSNEIEFPCVGHSEAFERARHLFFDSGVSGPPFGLTPTAVPFRAAALAGRAEPQLWNGQQGRHGQARLRLLHHQQMRLERLALPGVRRREDFVKSPINRYGSHCTIQPTRSWAP